MTKLMIQKKKKESAYIEGYPGLIPGWGRSPGEGVGYSLQDSWASLVAPLAKNLPAMWETWVQSQGWSCPLQFSCLENPHGQRRLAGYSPWDHRVRHNWAIKHTSYLLLCSFISKQWKKHLTSTVLIHLHLSHQIQCLQNVFSAQEL